jgi:hypothetical protein
MRLLHRNMTCRTLILIVHYVLLLDGVYVSAELIIVACMM